MPTFFTGGPVGRTVGCVDDHTEGTMRLVDIKEENIEFSQHKSIITRVTVSHNCNFQFLHTIGNDIYIYVFGDRIGQITISGLSFPATNVYPGGEGCEVGEHGFEHIMRWYEQYRVARRQDPIQITIGANKTIKGFVVALTGDVVDPATRMFQYNLQMMVLPER
jgi:hypothetical protein